ncbi:hypothetical protein [Microbacterium sp. lyk4-40-TSB-66]|jgi:hypothetical protein|uniref:hypothetical protein n=1 Tax=Microbacterium sp. lyk4-40-TSB-66 TaxID=3040294 RepID=UPI00254FB8C0|nr:hypothetical protein [Microbacterium sp. lyk4-40-TSB-66]
MRPWAVWAIGAALVALAWGVVQITPSDDAATEPFAVPVAVGETALARAFEVSVTDPRLGTRATAGSWSAEGTWLVVDVTATARYDEMNALLLHAELMVDGVAYRASERPASIFRQPLAVGVPRSGSLAFELPAAAVDRTGSLTLGLSDDTRLDSLVEVPIDLGSLTRQADVELTPTGWATP